MSKFYAETTGLAEVRVALLGIKNAYPKVVSRSINRTQKGVRTDAVDEIHKILNLTKARIRKDFSMHRASIYTLKGNVTAEGKPVNLATFSGTRPTKKGITFRVFRSGGRHLLKHAFLGKMKTKTGTYKTAFWRDWDKFRTQRRPGTFSKAKKHKKYRLPVTPREGPRVEDIYGRPAVMGAVLRKMDIRLEKNLDHELKHFLNNLFFE